jgi:hypothetical protein
MSSGQENTSTIHILSGLIKVALIPGGKAVSATHVFERDEPLSRSFFKEIEYSVSVNYNGYPESWLPMVQQRSQAAGWLIDTIFNPGDSLALLFRRKKDRALLQKTVFCREHRYPKIFAYRERKSLDPTELNLKAKAIRADLGRPEDFIRYTGGKITLRPGSQLEFVIKNAATNIDSCLLFRVVSAHHGASTPWYLTGHYLALRDIAANGKYLLELKYSGMDYVYSVEIQALPYWYQSGWVIAISVILTAALIFVIPYSFYNYRLNKEKTIRLQAEESMSVLQAKLNPHFISNALASIQLLVSGGQNDLANDYLARFYRMMRDSLENSGQLFITLAQELAMLDSYLALEQLRAEFRYEITIDEEIDPTFIEFPPMLLQPSVENAVKHGVSKLYEKGFISVIVLQQRDGIMILVKDNGGMSATERNPPEKDGIRLTRARVENLRKLHRDTKAYYNISYNSEGCTATFYFENLTKY